jgi:hypothetical protein
MESSARKKVIKKFTNTSNIFIFLSNIPEGQVVRQWQRTSLELSPGSR